MSDEKRRSTGKIAKVVPPRTPTSAEIRAAEAVAEIAEIAEQPETKEPCPVCAKGACELCRGTKMVTSKQGRAWRDLNEAPVDSEPLVEDPDDEGGEP